jgi:diguanylate cyclase (GGDEF)-like protein
VSHRAEARLATSVMEGMSFPLCAVDAEGRILACNAAWIEVSLECDGHAEMFEAGGNLLEAFAAAPDQRAAQALLGLRAVLRGDSEEFEQVCAWPYGDQPQWYSLRISPLSHRSGALIVYSDVTELVRQQELLRRLALHDDVTGLPNRVLMKRLLAERLTSDAGATAVLRVDLTGLRSISSSVGQLAGDQTLRIVAARLTEGLGEGVDVGHMSGDEFLVLAAVPDEPAALELARRVQEVVEGGPLSIGTLRVTVGATVGVAISDATTAGDELLSGADAALEVARRSVRQHVQVYDGRLREQGRIRCDVERNLASAVQRGELRVFYQPVVDTLTGLPHGVEALVRWQHPTRGLLAPVHFIEEAENSDVIHALGDFVLHQACRDVSRFPDLSLAVNVSSRQLGHPGLPATVRAALSRSGLPDERLLLEVTEHAVAADEQIALRVLGELRSSGVRVLVDDFGTGFSSLLYVKRYPVSGLKIDRSFVAGMCSDSGDRAIVASVVALAGALEIDSIAEGVETWEQRDQLARLGCRQLQGYLFGKPMPAEELPAALEALRRRVRQTRTRVAAPRAAPPSVEATTVGRVLSMRRAGASLDTIAAALNSDGVLPPSGRRWHRTAVAKLL